MPPVDDFRAGPEAHLATHPTALTVPQGQIYPLFTRTAKTANDWYEFQLKPGRFLKIEHSAPYHIGSEPVEGSETFTVLPNGADTGVNYLLYDTDKLTYMRLNDADGLVLTGPLEGCSVFVIRRDGDTYLFHVNDNMSSDDIPANVAAKDRKLDKARGKLLPRSRVTHRLTRGEYAVSAVPYRSFVLGRRIAGDWQFHYHTVAIDGPPLTARVHVAASPLVEM